MPDTNKVKFGIKNVYYALATIATDGTAEYDDPVAMPGAVNLALAPEGELSPFYADDVVYYQAAGNAGYTGNLELAKVPDSFKKDVLGYVQDSAGALVEDANAEVKPFALLFQMSGDKHARRHVLYNCAATRPELNAATITNTKEPITDSIPLSCTTIHNAGLNIDTPKASVAQSDTPYAGWFENVYQSTGTTP